MLQIIRFLIGASSRYSVEGGFKGAGEYMVALSSDSQNAQGVAFKLAIKKWDGMRYSARGEWSTENINKLGQDLLSFGVVRLKEQVDVFSTGMHEIVKRTAGHIIHGVNDMEPIMDLDPMKLKQMQKEVEETWNSCQEIVNDIGEMTYFRIIAL